MGGPVSTVHTYGGGSSLSCIVIATSEKPEKRVYDDPSMTYKIWTKFGQGEPEYKTTAQREMEVLCLHSDKNKYKNKSNRNKALRNDSTIDDRRDIDDRRSPSPNRFLLKGEGVPLQSLSPKKTHDNMHTSSNSNNSTLSKRIDWTVMVVYLCLSIRACMFRAIL